MTKDYSTTPIGQFDKQYRDLVLNVLDNGYSSQSNEHCVRTVYADGNEAHYKSTIGQRFHFDNTEVPVSTSKRLAWKSAIKELLWIWQKKSNVVQDLRDMNVNIWNEWEQEDGTIGKAYGYQLGKKMRTIQTVNSQGQSIGLQVDQVDYLLHQLRTNPNSRRHITMLWNPDELEDMSLTPCVYETQWHVKENKLHLEVRARSNDMALGNPFNVFQYNVLQRMFAQVLGYELGEYIFNVGDMHVYDRHEEELRKELVSEATYYEPPTLKINPDVTNFYDFTIDDFELIDYKHGKKRKYEVAI